VEAGAVVVVEEEAAVVVVVVEEPGLVICAPAMFLALEEIVLRARGAIGKGSVNPALTLKPSNSSTSGEESGVPKSEPEDQLSVLGLGLEGLSVEPVDPQARPVVPGAWLFKALEPYTGRSLSTTRCALLPVLLAVVEVTFSLLAESSAQDEPNLQLQPSTGH
jgi:hypothetical protein